MKNRKWTLVYMLTITSLCTKENMSKLNIYFMLNNASVFANLYVDPHYNFSHHVRKVTFFLIVLYANLFPEYMKEANSVWHRPAQFSIF